jgi:PAS domain S-box-containing protein
MPHDPADLVRRLLDRTLKQVDTHALMLLDPQGIIVGWLAGSEQLFGYRADEIVGQSVDRLFTPADLQNAMSRWERHTAASAGMSEDDRWQVRKDGAWIWVSGTLTALHDDNRQLIGFVKITRNRTDQKAQLEALEARLDTCKQADQQKNNFISTLAHELRNPLAAMGTATAILDRLSDPAEQTFAAGVVRRQVDFMNRMIDDLLEVTRSAAGKIQLRRQSVVLQEVIGRVVEVCRRLIDERTHTLQQLLPDVPITLDADPVRLEQVFINLLENAAKYTRTGGTIRIKASTEGDEAVVRVQDTGIGIAPEVMPHIFDLFTQADFPGRTQGGLGIGLSLVRDIVAQHGGSVQANSDGLGKGSEFTVRLPLPENRLNRPQRSASND